MNYDVDTRSTSPNAGFSLKELIVVLAIIFILIGVISAFFVRYIEKTNEQTDVYNMKIVQREAEASFLLGMLNPGTEYYFDESTGGMVSQRPNLGYGRGTSKNGGVYYTNYIPQMNVVGEYICAKAGNQGVEIYWNGFEPLVEEEAE